MPNLPQLDARFIEDGAITNAKIAAAAGIASTKLATWSADRNGGGYKLSNLGTPTSSTDAATKAYVDSLATASAAGLAVKQPVRVASTANISGTYNATGGASARGQFTGMPNTLDGVSLVANDRVLVKNQSSGAQNGIWVVSTLGSGSNGVWDRATDFDADDEVTDGTFVFVGEGTSNVTTQWVLTTNESITLGGSSGTALTFTQFGAGATYTADETTLTLSSTTFGIKAAGVGETQLASNAVTTVKIADGNVTADKLASNAVTTAKITDGNVTADKLASNAVTTVKIADDAVTQDKIADNAVGSAQIAAGAVDSSELASGSVTSGKLGAAAVTGPKIGFLVEEPTGTKNGSNKTFTLSAAAHAGASILLWRRIPMRVGVDYSVSSTTITILTTEAPESDDDLFFLGFLA